MIVRSMPSKNFTIVKNSILERSDISLKAKGLWAFLMTKPDNWSTSIRGLANELNDGETVIRSALKELGSVGLYIKSRSKNKSGRFVWEDCVYSEPQPLVGNPRLGKPRVENLHMVKRGGTNTEEASTDKTNTDINIYPIRSYVKVENQASAGDMFSYWKMTTGISLTGNVQANKNACERLLDKYSKNDLEKLIRLVAASYDDKFAPRVGDFVELENKTNSLLVWAKQQVAATRPQEEYII